METSTSRVDVASEPVDFDDDGIIDTGVLHEVDEVDEEESDDEGEDLRA